MKMDQTNFRKSCEHLAAVSQPLFPITNEDHSHPLFSAAIIDHTSDPKPQKELDWLENKSFDPGKFTKIQDNLSPVDHQSESDSSLEVERIKERIEVTEDVSDDDSVKKRKKKYKVKHKHKKHKHKHKKRSPSPSQTITIQDKLAQNYGKKVFIEQVPGLQFRDAYRVDRHADKDNWRFGSIYKEHIAKYHTHLDSCFGLQSGQTFQMKETKNKKTEKANKFRYFGKENRRFIRSSPAEQCRIPTTPKHENIQDEFIVLSDNKNEASLYNLTETETSDVRDQLLDCGTRAYVQGKAVGTSLAPNVDEPDYSIQRKVTEFNKLLREQPNNTELWLEFVKYQNIIYREDTVTGKEKTPRQALLDRKISILQKALESNPACIELKLKHLQLCEELWDSDKVNKEIEQLLFTYPTDVEVWKYYLTFNQSRLSIFSLSRVSKLYHKCITKLLIYRDGGVHSRQISGTLNKDILDIFVQYCHFLKQTGHTERAVATFQGMIEFNLFCPSKLENLTLTDMISVFESFWDSGVARIGENGAKGWKFWMDNKDGLAEEESPYKSDSPEEKEQEIVLKQQQKWKTWLDIELLRESSHLLPWRPDLFKNETEEDCEDMDRLVLFDDVSPALFTIPEDLYLELVLQFLNLLDINVSHFLLNFNNSSLEQLSLFNLHQAVNEHGVKFGVEVDIMNKNILGVFISNMLKQLISYFSGFKQTLLTVLLLNSQVILHRQDPNQTLGRSEVKEIKKFARSLLKLEHNRNNLTVWSAYAYLLWRLGQKKEAAEILQTAMSMFTCEDEDLLQMSALITLHRIYVEIILNFKSEELVGILERCNHAEDSNYVKAQHVLVCLAEGLKFDPNKSYKISPTDLLKARNKIQGKVDSYLRKFESLPRDNIELEIYFCELTKCSVLLEYTLNGVHSAISMLDKVITNVAERTRLSKDEDTGLFVQINTELCKYKIKLVAHYMTTVNAPLGLLRSVTDDSLERFPNNVYFLRVLVEIEQKSNISGRLHRYFSKCLKNLTSPIPVAIYVYSQLRRQNVLEEKMKEGKDSVLEKTFPVVMETGLIHRIRSYLEKALEFSQTEHCPLLWRLYLHAEMKFGYNERAKGVLYRALQNCPWSKMVYLDGVALFGENKLQEMVDLMMEKEIRVQIPVEEVDILTGADSMETS